MDYFEGWLSQLDVRRVQAELEEFEAKKAEIDHQIERRRQALGLQEHIEAAAEELSAGRNGTTSSGHPDPESSDANYPVASDAIRQIMGEHPTRRIKLQNLEREMVRRGLAAPSTALRARVQAAARRMAAKGELKRPRVGYYQLANPTFKTNPASAGLDSPAASELAFGRR